MSFSGGLVLLVGDGEEVEAFDQIPKVFGLGGVGSSNDVLKITGWDSTREEYRPGIADSSNIAIQFRRVLNDPIQERLIAGADAGDLMNFKLKMQDSINEEEIDFSAVLIDWQISPTIEDSNNVSISAKISGGINRAVGSVSGTLQAWILANLSPLDYFTLDEQSGTTFSNLGLRAIDLLSIDDAATFNIAGSSPHTSETNSAKQFDSVNNSLNVTGSNTTVGTFLNSTDCLIFEMKRSTAAETTVMSYTADFDGEVMQYKLTAGKELKLTYKTGDVTPTIEELILIPETYFMLSKWAFIAIAYTFGNGFDVYIDGIRRFSSGDINLRGGAGGFFRVGGDLQPVTAANDLQLDEIVFAGSVVSERTLLRMFNVWQSGIDSIASASVGYSSASAAIDNFYSTTDIGDLAVRTEIKAGEFIAYKLIFDAETDADITIIEGTDLNLFIYTGAAGGPYTLSQTNLAIHDFSNNEFSYSLTASNDVFLVFESTLPDNAIQFSTVENSPPSDSAFVDSVSALSPINWWRLNEINGFVANDSGSELEHLDYNLDAGTVGHDQPPSSLASGADARSKEFIASTDRLLAPADTYGQLPNGDFTLEFAVKLNAEGTAVVFGYLDNAAANNNQYLVQFIDMGTQTLSFTMYDNAGSFEQFLISGDFTAYVGAWAYISVTYNSTTQMLDTRINNVFESAISTSTIDMNGSPISGGVLVVGGFPGGIVGVAKNGMGVDEIQIYSGQLSGANRSANYSAWASVPAGNTGIGSTQLLAIDNAYPVAVEIDADSAVISDVPAGSWACWPLAASVLSAELVNGDYGPALALFVDLIQVEIWADTGSGAQLFVSGTATTAGNATGVNFDPSTFIDGYLLIRNNNGAANDLQSNVVED